MSGTDAIIARILSDAESKANTIISDAEDKVNEYKSQAETWCENYLNVQREMLKKDVEDIVSRRKTVAELDCRKIILAGKQDIISKVFKAILSKLCNLPTDKYLELVNSLVKEYGENNDKLIYADNSPLNEELLSNLESVKNLGIKIEGMGSFNGGVVLTNDICDKDLSFETLIQTKKSEIEKFVSDELFTEKQ